MIVLTRRREVFYAMLAAGVAGAGVAAALAGAGVAVLLLAADVFAHVRTQHVAGVNVWGYRGSPVPRKQQGEVRIVMAGGSTVFGWGLPDNESIPAFLERRLNQRGGGRRYSVVNLGAPGQG